MAYSVRKASIDGVIIPDQFTAEGDISVECAANIIERTRFVIGASFLRWVGGFSTIWMETAGMNSAMYRQCRKEEKVSTHG
jgi:hypothetical protein